MRFAFIAIIASTSAVKVTDIDGVHENAAHISTALGGLPTCRGEHDWEIPETNCTNRAAPLCNGLGTNGTPDVSCRRPIPICDGHNGRALSDCIPAPLPTCGPVFGGQPGVDCEIRVDGSQPANAQTWEHIPIDVGVNQGVVA